MFVRNFFVLLVIAGVLWGTGGVTGHGLAEHTGLAGPAIAAYRLTFGGLVLVTLLGPRGLHRAVRQPRAILTTAVLAAVFQAAYFAAVAVAAVSTATLITIGSSPIFVVLIQSSRHRHRRRPGPAEIRPVVLGVTGLALLVGSPSSGHSLSAALAGAALAALSGATFAVFTLHRARPSATDDEVSTGYGFLVGGLALATLFALFQPITFHPDAAALGLLLLLATVPTALAYTLFFRGLAGSSAATATVVALLEPLTGTLLAMLLFGDRLGWLGWIGAFLLLASVVDAGRNRVPGAVAV